MLLSILAPVKDERETLSDLCFALTAELQARPAGWELILIDDGSRDGSWEVIERLVQTDPDHVRAIRFRCNLGKADALAAGFNAARGDVVFTLDADLQDDPKEISRFLEKLNEGFDIVSGWKRVRHDPWHKVWPSRVFNKVLSRLAGVDLHDHNCGFKCYRSAVVKDIALYGGMHRMIPSLGWFKGYRCAEIEVEHHPRRFGRSKYGFRRFFKGFLDTLTVIAIRKFRDAPLHLTAAISFSAVVVGVGFIGIGQLPWPGGVPAFAATILGAGCVSAVFPLVAMGLIAELGVYARMEKERKLPIIEQIPAANGVWQNRETSTEKIVALPMSVAAGSPATEGAVTPAEQLSTQFSEASPGGGSRATL